MQSFGTAETGFSIEPDPSGGEVRVICRGFWGSALAYQFEYALRMAWREVGAGSQLVLDMSEFKPARDEVQRALAAVFGTLRGHSVAKVRVLTTSQLTKLQLLRIVRESGLGEAVTFS
jgi:hypothetical protein